MANKKIQADPFLANLQGGELVRQLTSLWRQLSDWINNAKVNDLSDVNAPTPANGDILVYNSATSTWVSAAPPVQPTSGTYTPTLTNTTNVAASTTNVCQWMRVGNVVTVGGNIAIDPTAAGPVNLGISLPVASALASQAQLGGAASTDTESALIVADAAADRATLQWSTVATTNKVWAFTFTYLVV